MVGPALTYVRYAGLFLAGSVLAGLWLRAGLYHPPLLEGVDFGNLVHAHSHLAFYGWASMGLFGVIVAFSDPPEWTTPYLRWHAHVMAVFSALAFFTFLRGGYSMESIAVSTGHVAGWFVFAGLAWPRGGRGTPEARPLFRLALGFLAVAGAGTLAPLVVMVQGASSEWMNRFAIEVFLVPFVAGWLIPASLGALFAVVGAGAPSRWAVGAIAVGVLPSALAFPPGQPPLDWLPLVGRIGLAAVAIGAGLLAVQVVRFTGGLTRIAVAALVLKTGVELVVASGLAADLMHNHSMTIAYLHVSLLGVVSAALLAALLSWAGDTAPRTAVAGYAVGLTLMVGPLALLGWPAGLRASMAVGVGVSPLLAVSLAGGVVLVAAVLPLAALLATAAPVEAVIRAAPDLSGRAAADAAEGQLVRSSTRGA